MFLIFLNRINNYTQTKKHTIMKEKIEQLVADYRRQPWNMETTLLLTRTMDFAGELKKSLKASGLGLTFFEQHIETPEAFCARLLRGNANKVGLAANYRIVPDEEQKTDPKDLHVSELVPKAIELLHTYPDVERRMAKWFPLVIDENAIHHDTATEGMANILSLIVQP